MTAYRTARGYEEDVIAGRQPAMPVGPYVAQCPKSGSGAVIYTDPDGGDICPFCGLAIRYHWNRPA